MPRLLQPTVPQQQPEWPDPERLDEVRRTLEASLPIVVPRESDLLKRRLAAVAEGRALLLQGGDCAERLHTSLDDVERRIDTLSRMASLLSESFLLPVVVVGRLAGQYAKPRSSAYETRDGVTLPSYRGDSVNGPEFTAAARTADPYRMLRAHQAAAATMNMVRALVGHRAGSPDTHVPEEMFVSHEALLLDHETPLTRVDPRTGRTYAGTGHLLWAGERTRDPDGAHIAFLAGVANPVAVKLGPAAEPDELLALVERLDPDQEPGRLTFVVRMGAGAVRERLPLLVEKVAASGARVGWVCDPMHGNTYTAPTGHKTRAFDDVLDEITGFFEVHHALGTHPGGIHLEMTGQDVTECVGAAGVGHEDLPRRYESSCDPRLNRGQSVELARRVAGLAAGRSAGAGAWR
ncbi:3-deoxy-7-phosphoheptulonate synthase [Streptomyces chilikensis]|uniref:Phospho-2-dehydro-3-deoxyheptonate aldolase n=1 Tax=Streptomyces chilikensis TaxID=1194079 RepID=A0ABV3EYJ7_9ACTN|nr:3-deoxy-7-phosphoheptulonate synthase class II [Streptomyces chilikensis]